MSGDDMIMLVVEDAESEDVRVRDIDALVKKQETVRSDLPSG
jgi:hypothetical protein